MSRAGGSGAVDSSWVDFSLGEDVRSESRLLQDEKWKESVSDGRKHVSHREANQVNSKIVNRIAKCNRF